jgi:molybdopterin-guanine dinucleotide biosynthesis protein A
MTQPYAVILAGGRGERLGSVRKADLRIGGIRLLDRVAAALGLVAQPLLVSTGPDGYHFNLPHDTLAVPDLPLPHAGPLAGLAAAVASLRTRGIVEGILVSVAVDTPFLPSRFAETMAQSCEGASACYAAHGENFYPTNAAWSLATIADLPERLAASTAPPGPRALLAELDAKCCDWVHQSAVDPFTNLNTLVDLIALQGRANSR